MRLDSVYDCRKVRPAAFAVQFEITCMFSFSTYFKMILMHFVTQKKKVPHVASGLLHVFLQTSFSTAALHLHFFSALLSQVSNKSLNAPEMCFCSFQNTTSVHVHTTE